MRTFEHAFITGASSGIGRRLAELLAQTGTHVVVAARREAELSELTSSIRAAGGLADPCSLDVTKPQDVHQAVAEWESRTGGLDLVVANAGVGVTRPAHKLQWSDIEPVLQVNVVGAFATLMAALPSMVARRRGTLVGMSSLASMRGLPNSGAYSASKAALSTFLETLRVDLRRYGIDVVDVRPGFVDTPMTRSNKFKMPFLVDVEEAARHTLDGLQRGAKVVAFPWPLATAMTVAERMPNAMWRGVAGRLRM